MLRGGRWNDPGHPGRNRVRALDMPGIPQVFRFTALFQHSSGDLWVGTIGVALSGCRPMARHGTL